MSNEEPEDSAITIRGALLIGFAALVLGGLGMRWARTSIELPVVPWISVVPLLLLAVLVLYSGWQIRGYTKGKAATMPTPQRARGSLVAAQAAALGGATLVGLYLSYIALHLANVDVPSVQMLILRAGLAALAALAVSVSGFVAQEWCRVPPDDDDDDPRLRFLERG